MRLIDADKSDEIIVFDKQNELLQCSVVRGYCERQREFLNKFPTIDAEPVVRCKDCKYWIREVGQELFALELPSGKCMNDRYFTAWQESRAIVPEDHFCADGERKGGE